MNKVQLLSFTFMLLGSFLWAQKSSREPFQPSFKETRKTTHKIQKNQKYKFGYLEVLENRNDVNSKTIKLPVYIFKSRSENPKPDPVIYTVGGPGYTSMRASQYMNAYKYLDDRDLILFEQRGNYYAKPHLDCPEWSEVMYMSGLPGFDGDLDSLQISAAISCREKLEKIGIDLNGYNTKQSAADIAELVQVLGIKEYNLLTMSYSTKIGQVMLRDYPTGIRSIVMDSPLPLEVNYDEESVSNLLASVDKLLSDCKSDDACSQAFPNLKQRFYSFLKAKTKSPLEVQVENPETGDLELFKLKGEDLIFVFTLSSIKDVPYEINKLLSGDFSSIQKQLTYLFKEPNGGAGIGMRLSVWCSEEYPFHDQQIIENETHRYPEVEGLSPAVYQSSICNSWGVKPMTEIENQAVESDVPVLLISGEYDNETPPRWANNMMKNLTNSFHLIFKGWTHGPTTKWSNPCAMEAANAFFNDPLKKPNPTCMGEIKLDFKVE